MTKIGAFGAALRCRPLIVITNAANRESTFNMGRRIMAERGRNEESELDVFREPFVPL